MQRYKLKELSIPPASLLLDIHNPRFYGEATAPHFAAETQPDTARAQEVIRRYLLKHHGISAIIDSILHQGFLPLDRLVVRRLNDEKYVVVEGNRRLAAIKTILAKTDFRILNPPKHVLASMASIDALLLEAEQQNMEHCSLLLQGIRHISGVRSWGPYQQGRLIYTLTQQEGMTFRGAAAAVGMSPSRVSSLLRGYCGLAQMQADPFFGKMADARLFSHFEQAYAKVPVRDWLGWQDKRLSYCEAGNLTIFYRCIIETEKNPPRLMARQIRDLLPAVLENATAKEAFTTGQSSIEEAYRLSQEGAKSYWQLAQYAVELKRLIQRPELADTPLEGIGLKAVLQLHQLTSSLLMRNTTAG